MKPISERIARTLAAYPAPQALSRLAHELAATKSKDDKALILEHIDAIIGKIA